MKILLVHNYYRQPGGEDQVFAAEGKMLASYGHPVSLFTADNGAVRRMSRLSLLGATVWNRGTAARLRAGVNAFRPDVVHFHNTFPLISPSGYAAARAGGAAVVQTLHNYRMLCPNAILFRDGRTCESCLGRAVAWPGVLHGCYRSSRGATAVVAASSAIHRALGTYRRSVDLFITPSEFARRKLVSGGLPAASVVAKPHFLAPDPGPGDGGGGYALFVGRFSDGKGVQPLLAGWPRLARPYPLKVVGDGDLAPLVRRAAEVSPGVEWLGYKTGDEVLELMGRAALVVVPSECYETFGLVVVEAFARGTPVLASDHGAPAELVEPGVTGGLFRAGDPDDLARQADRLLADPEGLARMRHRVREEYLAKYTEVHNHGLLTGLYRRVLETAAVRRPARQPVNAEAPV